MVKNLQLNFEICKLPVGHPVAVIWDDISKRCIQSQKNIVNLFFFAQCDIINYVLEGCLQKDKMMEYYNFLLECRNVSGEQIKKYYHK